MHNIPLLEIAFHWPHNRLALGWQVLEPKGEEDYYSVELFLGVMTIQYNHV